MAAPDAKTRRCTAGKEVLSAYACKFCSARPLHRGDEGCTCSTLRTQTHYATLCPACAEALDTLNADTVLGRVHRDIVYAANIAGRPSSD